MPKPLDVDWDFVKALWLQGFTPSQISAKTGIKPDTVKGRALRYKWTAIRDKTNAFLNQSLQPDLSASLALSASKQTNALAKASKLAQEAFSDELHTQVSVLRKKPAKRVSDLASNPRREGRASVVSKLVSTAAKLYGWDAQTNTPTHVSLTKVDVHHAGSTSVKDSPALDVPYE